MGTIEVLRSTNHFPSVEQEAQMRSEFLYLPTNPYVHNFETQLRKKHIKFHRQNILSNLTAFAYGLHFYNEISQHALFQSPNKPIIKIIRNRCNPLLMYIRDRSRLVYVNTGSPEFNMEFSASPFSDYEINGEPEIDLPLYYCHILDGLEEASHLHLNLLHIVHQSNNNSASDHPHPERLWVEGASDPNAYRAKLWHEYAALIIQKQFFLRYLSPEFPQEAKDFVKLYQNIKRKRKLWISSRLTTRTEFV